MLRTGVNVARDVLSAQTKWEGIPNRILLHDPTTLSNDSVLMPMVPLRTMDFGRMEAI